MMQRQPTPQQFTLGMLKFYKKYRAMTDNTIANNFAYTLLSVTSPLTGVSPKRDILNEIILEVKAFTLSATTPEEIFELIILLRKYAVKAQEQKLLSGSSKLHNILQACANVWIDSIENSEVFKNKKHSLKDEHTKKVNEINSDIKERRGINVEKLSNELMTIVYALACMKDEEFVTQAMNYKLFPYLSLPNKKIFEEYKITKEICMFSFPLQFQKTYEKGLYLIDFVDYKEKKFNDFSDFLNSCCDIQMPSSVDQTNLSASKEEKAEDKKTEGKTGEDIKLEDIKEGKKPPEGSGQTKANGTTPDGQNDKPPVQAQKNTEGSSVNLGQGLISPGQNGLFNNANNDQNTSKQEIDAQKVNDTNFNPIKVGQSG